MLLSRPKPKLVSYACDELRELAVVERPDQDPATFSARRLVTG